MLKKINIEKYPKIKKSLNSFFNDVNKYFETSYDDKYLIIGNTHTGKKTILFSGKNRNKKINRRISISKANLKLSNDSQNKSIIIQKSLSRFLNEEKKRKYTSADGNSLKPGQRFIEDKEIENIFNLYKELRNINKNKKNNFATLKELNESKNIFDSYFSKKSKNFNSIINLKKHKNKEIYKSSNNKEKDRNFLIIKDFHNEINKNINHKSDIENYKTYSTFSSFKDELTNKNNFMSFDIDDSNNNIINKLKINSSNEIKEKQKLLNKQKQYISQKTDVTIKNRFAQVLALQEKVFLNKNKNRNNQLQLKNYLSSKIKRAKNKLLLVKSKITEKIMN